MVDTALEALRPGSFQVGGGLSELVSGSGGTSFPMFAYFSFVTLTTPGFGDITPVSPAARVFSFLEAVTGRLYIAVLIAALVGIHISHRVRGGAG